eukprot:3188342-Rhodomonas_salina.3
MAPGLCGGTEEGVLPLRSLYREGGMEFVLKWGYGGTTDFAEVLDPQELMRTILKDTRSTAISAPCETQ